jgi:hypothetical protein
MQHSANTKLRDSTFLFLVLTFSSVLYIGGLGFYSDDWAVFGNFKNVSDPSLSGLFKSFYSPEVAKRPVQIFYYAFLYKLFGLHPLGHHLFNHLMFGIAIVLFYLNLTELRVERTAALAISAVFAFLPHYSTARFWFMSFQVNLSMAFYFFSLFCDLKALTAGGRKAWVLKLLAWISIFASILAYELFLPLFFLNIFFVLYHSKKAGETSSKRKFLLCLSNFFVLLFVIAVKLILLKTTRVIMQSSLDHFRWFVNILIDFTKMSYGTYGLELPVVLKKSLIYTDWKTISLSIAITIVIFLYLFRQASSFTQNQTEMRKGARYFILAGLAIFFVAFTVFLLSENASVTPSGINNRFTSAATIGVAISMIGIIGWIVCFSNSPRFRQILFCICAALLCGAGLLVNNAIANFWVSAYEKEKKVLNEIRETIPAIPQGSTVILDGACPYDGPAIVFESSWDLQGALLTMYPSTNLKANIVRPTMQLTKDAIQTTLYGEVFQYPYQNLFIFDSRSKQVYKMNTYDEARTYFETRDPFYGIQCPDGIEGFGVPIF